MHTIWLCKCHDLSKWSRKNVRVHLNTISTPTENYIMADCCPLTDVNNRTLEKTIHQFEWSNNCRYLLLSNSSYHLYHFHNFSLHKMISLCIIINFSIINCKNAAAKLLSRNGFLKKNLYSNVYFVLYTSMAWRVENDCIAFIVIKKRLYGDFKATHNRCVSLTNIN